MLTFSVKRVYKFNGEGPLKAIVDLVIGEEFLVKGFRVVEGKNGLFISGPTKAGNNGKWYSTALALTDETKREVERVVMEAFENEDRQ